MVGKPRERSGNIVYGVLCLIIGGFMFFGSIGILSQPNTVSCGDQTMSQGDTCEQFSNGSYTGSRDYAQQQQSNQTTGIFALVFGLLFVVGGIFLLFSRPGHTSASSSSPSSMRSRTNSLSQSGSSPSSPHSVPQPGASPPSSSPRQPEGWHRESS